MLKLTKYKVVVMEDIKIQLNDIVVSAYQNFLIVDDDEAVHMLLKKELLAIGFKGLIHSAKDIYETKRMLKYEKVDFILCDWNLPDHSGVSLLKAIRKSQRFDHIPFVLVTKKADVDSILLAQDLGCSEYLVKPFTSQDLIDKLKSAWERHTLETQGHVHQLMSKIKKLEKEISHLKEQLRQP